MESSPVDNGAFARDSDKPESSSADVSHRPLSLTFHHALAGPSQQPMRLSLMSTTTVRSTKSAIAEHLRLPAPSAIELVFRDTKLPDRATLGECNVGDGAAITLAMQTVTGRPVRSAGFTGAHPHLECFRPLGTVVINSQPVNQRRKGGVPRDLMRSKALQLIDRGIAGLVVVPGAIPGTRRVVLVNRETLELLKAMRRTRLAAGRPFLGEGSDEDVLSAMQGVLGEAEEAAVAPINDIAGTTTATAATTTTTTTTTTTDSDSDSARADSTERERTHVLLQKLLASKERRHQAVLDAVRKTHLATPL
jgi:hypothetical protein